MIDRSRFAAARPRRPAIVLAASCAAMLLSGCATPVGPVEVTRFHLPEAQSAAHGTIALVPGPATDLGGFETRPFANAVEAELQRLGYTVVPASAGSAQQAVIEVQRQRFRPDRRRGPVSVGMGGSTGSYGSGVGLGIGIDLSGPPPEQVATEIHVSIREAASQRTLWEGRANYTVSVKSPSADSGLGAAKMAQALFRDWPGRSGETIEVQ